MRKERKRRGIFEYEIAVPETDEEFIELATRDIPTGEDLVRGNLDRVRKICDEWRPGSGKQGSDDIVDRLRSSESFLRGELEVTSRRNLWRVASLAMDMATQWRDLVANESLLRPVEYARNTRQQRDRARARAGSTNADTAEAANLSALNAFEDWQRKTTQALVDGANEPLSAEDRVALYIKKKHLARRSKERIRSLLAKGRIPPIK